ncbi:FadR/GntR family transcriptional regulator [Pseudomonas syringae]|uniref:Transcriptional regulator n=1 Tax=Pseudomonas syringae TaxID=317 RepID=A0A085V8J6_PSESX|nr:FCD domain-containing protein [Pseudomonas syringae]KFE51759.1 transcriptional regulator [Pseudomonas syringae]
MALPINADPTESSFRLVARTIEQRILAGEITPGDTLPAEAKLAEQLGVNRSTIREAIRVLEQNGFVKREPGRRKLIASIPHSGDISKRLTATMVLNQVTFEELWEAMYALEPAAASAAALRANDDDFTAIEANLAATRQTLQNSASLVELDIEFHDLVAKATRNRAIQMARSPLSELFYPPFYAVMSHLNAGQRLLIAHESIYAAIREHDSGKAREWMEKHIQDFERGYELANLDMSAPVNMPAK